MHIALDAMNEDVMKDYMVSLDSVKHDILGYLNKCLNDATIKKEDIKKSIALAEETFSSMEQKIVQTAKILNGDITTYFRILSDGKSEVYMDL